MATISNTPVSADAVEVSNSSVEDGAPPPNLLSTPVTHITTHDADTKLSVFHASNPAAWTQPISDRMSFALAFTQSQRPTFDDNADIVAHEALEATGNMDIGKCKM